MTYLGESLNPHTSPSHKTEISRPKLNNRIEFSNSKIKGFSFYSLSHLDRPYRRRQRIVLTTPISTATHRVISAYNLDCYHRPIPSRFGSHGLLTSWLQVRLVLRLQRIDYWFQLIDLRLFSDEPSHARRLFSNEPSLARLLLVNFRLTPRLPSPDGIYPTKRDLSNTKRLWFTRPSLSVHQSNNDFHDNCLSRPSAR